MESGQMILVLFGDGTWCQIYKYENEYIYVDSNQALEGLSHDELLEYVNDRSYPVELRLFSPDGQDFETMPCSFLDKVLNRNNKQDE